MPDHRLDELKECELCDAAAYTVHTTPQPGADCGCDLPTTGPVDEALVQKITDTILKKLS